MGKLRSSMNPSTLNDLIMIHMNGPSLEGFVSDKSVDRWYSQQRKDTLALMGIRDPPVSKC
jgi:hypothetical protein